MKQHKRHVRIIGYGDFKTIMPTGLCFVHQDKQIDESTNFSDYIPFLKALEAQAVEAKNGWSNLTSISTWLGES